MSRTLSTCTTLPVTGSYIELPFPDLAKPVPGGWSVEVGLRATSGDTGDAMISVQQGGRVIASKRVTPTTSFSTFGLALTDEDLDEVTTGLCHVTGPTVIISDAVATCCEIPGLSLYVTCDEGTTQFERASVEVLIFSQFSAGDCFPGQISFYIISCRNSTWYFVPYPGDGIPMVGSCDPVVHFEFTFNGRHFTVTE